MPTKGLAYTKHALNYSFINSIEEQLQLEDKYQQNQPQRPITKKASMLFWKKETRIQRKLNRPFNLISMEKNAQAVVAHMMEHDLFSQWLGIEVLDIREGYSRIG